MSLFYAIVCSTLSCFARLRRAHRSLKRCIYSTSHINRNIAQNPKTQSKMLTLHQFLAYCSRNNIQTVQYNQIYSHITDTTDVRINLLTEEHHYEYSGSDDWCDSTLSCVNPEDFYRWCILNNDSYFLEEAVRRHMRAKCKPQNVFLSDCLPF